MIQTQQNAANGNTQPAQPLDPDDPQSILENPQLLLNHFNHQRVKVAVGVDREGALLEYLVTMPGQRPQARAERDPNAGVDPQQFVDRFEQLVEILEEIQPAGVLLAEVTEALPGSWGFEDDEDALELGVGEFTAELINV